VEFCITKVNDADASASGDSSDTLSTRRVVSKMKVIVKGDPTLVSMGSCYVTIYGDKDMKNTITRFTVMSFDFQKHVTIVEGNTFYYTVLSPSWYNGCPPSNTILTVLDLTHDFKIDETEVINGTIYNALVYVQAMLKSRLNNLDLILVQLLRGLEFCKDRQCTQSINRTFCNKYI
jgi:hypothetical protein